MIYPFVEVPLELLQLLLEHYIGVHDYDLGSILGLHTWATGRIRSTFISDFCVETQMYKLQIMLTLGQNHRDLCW
jgi:hypothetical protein